MSIPPTSRPKRKSTDEELVEQLLQDLDDYVEDESFEDSLDHEQFEEEEEHIKEDVEMGTQGSNAAIKAKIRTYKSSIKEIESQLKPLAKEKKVITDRLDKNETGSQEFRSARKRSDEGIESKLLRVLEKFEVESTRYHGGNLAGTDIKKVIADAVSIFDEFEENLKENQKEDSPYLISQIETLCQSHKEVFLLWDGAFSLAHTISPTKDDYNLYLDYAKAAMDMHVAIGCSVTHKCHLMLVHLLSISADERSPLWIGGEDRELG